MVGCRYILKAGFAGLDVVCEKAPGTWFPFTDVGEIGGSGCASFLWGY